MIPAAFDYARPQTLDEAVRTLADGGEDAKVLAGGQSLIPILRLRLAFPELLVDVGRIAELRGVREEADALVIGAMTTHHDVIHDPLVRSHAGLLAAATETVADPSVRHRGTLGGSLSHADPAGDLPAVLLALDGEMVAMGPQGRRTIPAREFFTDYLQTALRPDELLVEVRVPKSDNWGYHYEKFNQVAQAWAIVGVAAMVRRDDGHLVESRVALTNMGATPLRASATEEALAGADADPAAVARAAESAADGTRPASDLSASPEYREHLARVLTRRAVLAAAGME
ncbi:xanthine dehydrogenase family protein subunit M [Streptomyces lunaelactis]|uniref:FAD binding domain-containing protein n=1 Tax=Streptomyces lunaelactis TaxID=1535768 RepID=UPI0015853E24|nr:xanthine dehydrogenase family protein subunit M [Streptomyces lunaelactis]NUK04932.1 xanthine dehydrogenase family protein subunit M [Streptomyces lunaelactis]NUK13726.1 xanthine dehydrogenase family protein subunit M [Streptomyces lunaelactis]NUK50062.1 xanthine dehydrogenase family protein subunit M [Streptomyces lunaelactis]NUK57132.1 xanthine dehydrogenase family protein subunit M [Streptomyces lunaelactis]NUK64314.1 xanthine dehydrogenase family protein subunit M [Streptomyces lunaelac